MRAINIEWDTKRDEIIIDLITEDDEYEKDMLWKELNVIDELPSEVDIPDSVEWNGGYDDEIANCLSDIYGYCVFTFEIVD